jgi:hypothetical protein
MPIAPDELTALQELISVRHHLRDILDAAVHEQLTPLPPLPGDPATLQACEALIDRYARDGVCTHIPDEAFSIPKWVFIEHAIRQGSYLAHGSGNASIAMFEPRVAHDNLEGGDQPRVYAASSGVLAGFYAIVDRQRLDELLLIPALINLYIPPHAGSDDDRFHFALDWRALPYRPWQRGTLYLLPRTTFESDHRGEQWFSAEPVVPQLTISLAPEEWPLLDQVRGADIIAFLRRINQSLAGWPWWPDPTIYPLSGA